jgi:hypothetical protein
MAQVLWRTMDGLYLATSDAVLPLWLYVMMRLACRCKACHVLLSGHCCRSTLSLHSAEAALSSCGDHGVRAAASSPRS